MIHILEVKFAYTDFILIDEGMGKSFVVEKDNFCSITLPSHYIMLTHLKLSTMKTKRITAFLCLILISMGIRAQVVDPNQQLVITLKDGSIYHGALIFDDGREMKFNTNELGLMVVKKQELKRMEKSMEKKTDAQPDYTFLPKWKEGPFSTRYAITTNAFPIKKGENYGMLNFHGPEIHFAVTDRLNVGYMTTWAASPMAISLKYSFDTKNEKLHFGVGSLLLSSGFFQKFKGYGTLTFGNVTFGDRKSNVTLSGGYLYWQTGAKVIKPGAYTIVDSLQYSSYSYSYLRDTDGPLSIPGSLNMNVLGSDSLQTGYATHGPIFGLSGTYPLGEKASLILESMFGVLNCKREQIDRTTITTLNEGNQLYTNETTFNVSEKSFKSTFIYLAPAVRFQSTANFAWQITIASTSVVKSDSSTPFTMPIPMVTLFKKF